MFASCADLLQAYPTTLKPVTLELLLPTLTERWTNHLFNQIWLVCDDAARALERALHAYPSTLEPVILELLKENIVCAKGVWRPSCGRGGVHRDEGACRLGEDQWLYLSTEGIVLLR